VAGIGGVEAFIAAVVVIVLSYVLSRTIVRLTPEAPLAARLDGPDGPDPVALEELADGMRDVRTASGDVAAIKYVRQQTGWGLLEAKTYVDRLT
jgi:ribosomal protein L7/L12